MDFAIIQLTSDNKIQLKSLDTPVRITGMQALVQQVLIELLSDPIPARARGAGLLAAINELGPTNNQNANSLFARVLATAQTHILANQQLAKNINDTERLLRLEYMYGSIDSFEWLLEFRIINVAGESTVVKLPSMLGLET